MIERIEIENFGSIRKAAFDLTPLHAFIGPNDAGKTTILEAAQQIAMGAGGQPVSLGRPGVTTQELSTSFSAMFETNRVLAVTGRPQDDARTRMATSSSHTIPFADYEPGLHIPIYRLSPADLRLPCKLFVEARPIRLAPSGFLLPAALDALQNRQLDDYLALRARFLTLFPTNKDLILTVPEDDKKAVGIRLKDGREVSAQAMSEGMLFWLAFAVMQYAEHPPILLIEEPETGLHPARIAEVIRTLRLIAESGTQVLLTTHSPLVVNELAGNEITVVTRTDEAGTVGKRLCNIPDYERSAKAWNNGELWVAFSNGIDEARLLRPTS